jgi:hypothetical protein
MSENIDKKIQELLHSSNDEWVQSLASDYDVLLSGKCIKFKIFCIDETSFHVFLNEETNSFRVIEVIKYDEINSMIAVCISGSTFDQLEKSYVSLVNKMSNTVSPKDRLNKLFDYKKTISYLEEDENLSEDKRMKLFSLIKQ